MEKTRSPAYRKSHISHIIGIVLGIASPPLNHNGSISRDSVPLWNGLYLRTVATGSVNGISSSSICRNGSIS